MIKSRLVPFVIALCVFCAEAGAETSTLYQGPLPVKIKDRLVTVPVTLSGETTGADADTLLLRAAAYTRDLSPILKEQLQILADDNISACELRITVPETDVGAVGTELILSALVNAEAWVCTSFLKTRLGSETARITASVTPQVRDGRLHLQPGTLSIDGIGDLIASIGGNQILQNLYFQAIERFNNDPELTSLPGKLADAGFSYQSAKVEPAGTPTLTVAIAGPNDLVYLAKIIAGIR